MTASDRRAESTPTKQGDAKVIATGPVHHWIEPWYGAYAILGALASGFAAILIPLTITRAGGSASSIGTAVAAQNLGALSAPVWGLMADRTKAYRIIFFLGFLLIGSGFLVFAFLTAFGAWIGAAFLIGFGTGASNTVASLFVVEFTPKPEWHRRISWLQTFNAGGSVLGMAAAGYLDSRVGMLLAAGLAVLGIAIGRYGLPVPGGPFHIPRFLHGDEIASLLRHGGPSASAIQQHHWRLADVARLARDVGSPFGLFLVGWFAFSLAVSSFGSLYPVLMQRNFGVPPGAAATLISVATAISIPLYNLAGRLDQRWGAPAALGVGYWGRLLPLAGLAALAYVQPGFGFSGAIVLFGIFQAIWPLISVASNDLAASLAPFGEGPAIGLFNAVAAVASAIGAVAGGAIADALGYAAVPAFAAAAVLAALATVRRKRG